MTGQLVRRMVTPPARRQAGLEEILLGLAVTGGAVLASALVSARNSPAPTQPAPRRFYKRLEKPPFTPPDAVFGIWGPLYAALTVSGLRVWLAPRSPARTQALAHWFLIQLGNALSVWLGFGKRRLGASAAETALTVVNAAAYAESARRVDGPAAALALPYVAWIGFAAVLTEELWRRNR